MGLEGMLRLLENVQQEASYVIVFSTGVGVSALLQEAEKLGRLDELRKALQRGTTVCPGAKPLAALKRSGLNSAIQVKEPCTTTEFLSALAPLRLKAQFVVVLHDGERNRPLVESLLGRCAGLQELLLQKWRLPEDTAPHDRLVKELIGRRASATAFTGKMQERHLLGDRP